MNLELTLICGSDDRYASAAAVALSSGLRHLPAETETEVLYLADGLTETSRDRLRCVVERARPGTAIRFCTVSEEDFAALPTSAHLSRSTNLRLLFARFMPADSKRALYLDSDSLVVRSLAPLLTIPDGAWAVAATQDYIVPSAKWPEPDGVGGSRTSATVDYFNAGILLIDVERWRAYNVEGLAVAFMQEHPEAISKVGCDQDLLNAVLIDRWLALEPEWNVCSQLFYLEEFPPDPVRARLLADRGRITRSAAIVHFSGQPKPWHHWSTHPYTDAWARAFDTSRWETGFDRLWWHLAWRLRRLIIRAKLAVGQLKKRESIDDYSSPAIAGRSGR